VTEQDLHDVGWQAAGQGVVREDAAEVVGGEVDLLSVDDDVGAFRASA
jgi:hypothetical protein